MTAWSAKVVTSSICLSVNGRTDFRPKVDDANRRSFSQERDAKKRANATSSSAALGYVYSGSARTSRT